MGKSKLPLWTFSYRPTYYLTHPQKLFYDLYWNTRNFLHRGKYGYAFVDVWNFDNWFMTIIPEMLRYLAKKGCGYPGSPPYETREKWEEFLLHLASEFEACAEDSDKYVNEHEEKFEELLNERKTDTFEFKILKNKYLEKDKEIRSQKAIRLKKAMIELSTEMPRLWD